MKSEKLTGADMRNIAKKTLSFIGTLSTKSKPFLIHQPTAINQKPILTSL